MKNAKNKHLHLCLIMAMQTEALPLIQLLGLQKKSLGPFFESLQFCFYQGFYKNTIKVSIVLPGKDPRFDMDSIGTEPAAVASFIAVKELQPDILISAGTAGSFKKLGAHIGKVYLSDAQFFYHDHRISIPKWDQYGEGAYPGLDVYKIAQALELDQSNISSGCSLDFTDQDIKSMLKHKAALKEMEATAVAWVGFVTNTPVFAIKSVTNLLDENPDSATEFIKNFALAVDSLTVNVEKVFEYFLIHFRSESSS